MQETRVQSLGWEDPLEEDMGTHSSTLAWEIPWKEEPGGLQSMGLQESDTTLQLNHHHQSNANTSFGLFFHKFAYSLTLSMCWTLNTRLFDVYHHVGFPNYVLLFRILNLLYTHEQTAYLFY